MTAELGQEMTLAALPAVVDLMTVARALGIRRKAAYALARGGSFPCPVFWVGAGNRVPTSGLLRLLGLAT
ncbi:DNA-binding protein [Amycolatopsis sp. NPDC004169]|uniref:DNA-binding protein n=1 Tax=Amycolatopsis sp. NPDC004169 TaxID=3154453 RepID=UPI0033A75F61